MHGAPTPPVPPAAGALQPRQAAGTARASTAQGRAAAAISCEAHSHPAHELTRLIKYKNKTSLKTLLWKEKKATSCN